MKHKKPDNKNNYEIIYRTAHSQTATNTTTKRCEAVRELQTSGSRMKAARLIFGKANFRPGEAT